MNDNLLTDDPFWAGTNTLVLGAGSYLGRFLSAELLHRGAEVFALVSKTDPKPHHPNIRPLHGDDRDANRLTDLFFIQDFPIIFQLANPDRHERLLRACFAAQMVTTVILPVPFTGRTHYHSEVSNGPRVGIVRLPELYGEDDDRPNSPWTGLLDGSRPTTAQPLVYVRVAATRLIDLAQQVSRAPNSPTGVETVSPTATADQLLDPGTDSPVGVRETRAWYASRSPVKALGTNDRTVRTARRAA